MTDQPGLFEAINPVPARHRGVGPASKPKRRLLPWVDAHQCGRYEELPPSADPDEITAQLRADGALAVGEPVTTRVACTAWYKAWEAGQSGGAT